MVRPEDASPRSHWIAKMFNSETVQQDEYNRIQRFWHSMGVMGLKLAYPFFDGMIKKFSETCPNCRKRFWCMPWLLYLSGFRVRKFYGAMRTVYGNCEKWNNGGMELSFIVGPNGVVRHG